MGSLRSPDGQEGVWKRTLFAVFAAQMVATLSFNFINPFLPLFIVEDPGVSDPGQAAFWTGITQAAGALSSFVTGPLWGVIGDRYGRKVNLVRTLWGSAVLTALTALAPNVYVLVLMRFLAGTMAGVFSTSLALVSSQAPSRRRGYAIGMMQVAFFMGLALGPMIGGVVAEGMGYRNTFYLTGGLLLANGLMILSVVREEKSKTTEATSWRPGDFFAGVWRVASSKAVLPALVLLLLVQSSTVAFNPVVPGFILELSPGGSSGRLTELGFGMLNLASAVSALAVAQVVDRWGVRRIMVWSGVASAMIFTSAVLLESSWQLVALMGAVGVTSGAMLSGANTVASASVSSGQYGVGAGAAAGREPGGEC